MNNQGLKNIVVLRDLPSNLIEEAIIVLKENKKIHKYQISNLENKNNGNNKNKEDKTKNKKDNKNNVNEKRDVKNLGRYADNKDYIIKEAEMVLEEYTEKLEQKSVHWKSNAKKLEKRYKISIKINFILTFISVIGIILSLI